MGQPFGVFHSNSHQSGTQSSGFLQRIHEAKVLEQMRLHKLFLVWLFKLSMMTSIEFEVLQNGRLPGDIAGDDIDRRVHIAEIVQSLYPGGSLWRYRRG
jgi:hypothetical protein